MLVPGVLNGYLEGSSGTPEQLEVGSPANGVKGLHPGSTKGTESRGVADPHPSSTIGHPHGEPAGATGDRGVTWASRSALRTGGESQTGTET